MIITCSPTAAACLSSACSFAVSQASDLALLVGYVAYEDFNFKTKYEFFLPIKLIELH